jgi:hypothetical protein
MEFLSKTTAFATFGGQTGAPSGLFQADQID